ncbi:DNA-binding protein RFX6-like, partial [Stegodyphus dumicola]|uniref:DNA-binding protein RFX6-like n=1 Tax=Stegodyphus dumicola TaxID=202533 RepID=UPI0015A7DC6E
MALETNETTMRLSDVEMNSMEVCKASKQRKSSTIKGLLEKKKQVGHTIKWLKDNYCPCPDVCLPREIVYDHYLEYCKGKNIVPTCKATFGKLIRNTFPDVTSKRLGARGHSKYHYNGIGIKLNSDYSVMSQGTKGLTRFSGSSKIE